MIDEEKAFECRDCRKRVFGDHPPDPFDIDKWSQGGDIGNIGGGGAG